jgi:hypothetical protein
MGRATREMVDLNIVLILVDFVWLWWVVAWVWSFEGEERMEAL